MAEVADPLQVRQHMVAYMKKRGTSEASLFAAILGPSSSSQTQRALLAFLYAEDLDSAFPSSSSSISSSSSTSPTTVGRLSSYCARWLKERGQRPGHLEDVDGPPSSFVLKAASLHRTEAVLGRGAAGGGSGGVGAAVPHPHHPLLDAAQHASGVALRSGSLPSSTLLSLPVGDMSSLDSAALAAGRSSLKTMKRKAAQMHLFSSSPAASSSSSSSRSTRSKMHRVGSAGGGWKNMLGNAMASAAREGFARALSAPATSSTESSSSLSSSSSFRSSFRLPRADIYSSAVSADSVAAALPAHIAPRPLKTSLPSSSSSASSASSSSSGAASSWPFPLFLRVRSGDSSSASSSSPPLFDTQLLWDVAEEQISPLQMAAQMIEEEIRRQPATPLSDRLTSSSGSNGGNERLVSALANAMASQLCFGVGRMTPQPQQCVDAVASEFAACVEASARKRGRGNNSSSSGGARGVFALPIGIFEAIDASAGVFSRLKKEGNGGASAAASSPTSPTLSPSSSPAAVVVTPAMQKRLSRGDLDRLENISGVGNDQSAPSSSSSAATAGTAAFLFPPYLKHPWTPSVSPVEVLKAWIRAPAVDLSLISPASLIRPVAAASLAAKLASAASSGASSILVEGEDEGEDEGGGEEGKSMQTLPIGFPYSDMTVRIHVKVGPFNEEISINIPSFVNACEHGFESALGALEEVAREVVERWEGEREKEEGAASSSSSSSAAASGRTRRSATTTSTTAIVAAPKVSLEDVVFALQRGLCSFVEAAARCDYSAVREMVEGEGKGAENMKVVVSAATLATTPALDIAEAAAVNLASVLSSSSAQSSSIPLDKLVAQVAHPPLVVVGQAAAALLPNITISAEGAAGSASTPMLPPPPKKMAATA